MTIPENPQSRSEQYLNAIATGDNSGLPEFPQSRMEQYLEVIAQNGGGGSSGGGVLVVHVDENDVLDKTWQEIHDAPFAILRSDFDLTNMSGVNYATLTEVSADKEEGEGYAVAFKMSLGDVYFVTDSPNGYPTHSN